MNPIASIDKLSASIAQLSVRVDKFAEDVHNAKEDMEDLSEKLSSLEDCLEILEADFENPAIRYPDRRKKNLRRMLEDCDRITKEMATLLKSLVTASGEVSWSGFSKTKMGKLQDSLEADTSAMLLVISMSKRPSAEEDHQSSLSNPSQDTESMLSIRQSLLETACVPYAIEDPYAGATSKSEQMLAAYHAAKPTTTMALNGGTKSVHRDRNPISMRHRIDSVTVAPADRAIRGDVQGSQLDRARRLHGDINGAFVHLWSDGNATSPQEARNPIPDIQQFIAKLDKDKAERDRKIGESHAQGKGADSSISQNRAALQQAYEHSASSESMEEDLRREQAKVATLEERLAELEATLPSSAVARVSNSLLREKRTVLDTQKEIVIRELEVLTEHTAAAKWSGEPIDLEEMRGTVVERLTQSLNQLKDSFAPQIEESMRRKNNLVDEISRLLQAKDDSLREFEQLALRNAQLSELNNQLASNRGIVHGGPMIFRR